jgi:hypothetical protein
MRHYLMIGCVIGAVLVGCGPTKQARSVENSGFLGDLYSQMHKGQEGEALLVYRNPKAARIQRGTYTKILLDPVQVWGAASSSPENQRDLQQLADMLYSLVYQSLAKDYDMVTEAGPNTLHIQAALTGADRARVGLRAISTVPAPMNVLALGSMVKNLGTGKPAFVGEASAEVRLRDSLTGEVLAATADRRVGTKRLDFDSFNSWDDAHKTLEYWAEKVRYRLCQQREITQCIEPKG